MLQRILLGRMFFAVAAFCLLYSTGFLRAADNVMLPEFSLRSWGSGDGLPPANVQAIARTTDGYLWGGTSQGLARFDGVRFVVLDTNNTPALGDNHISCLLVARSGDLWVGTEGGSLARRHGGKFEPVAMPPSGQQRRRINALVEDAEGALWIGLRSSGVMRYHRGAWENFTHTNGLPADGATQLVADKQGRLLAVSGARLVMFTAGRWEVVPGFSSVRMPVVAIAPARDGGVWVATSYDPAGVMGCRVYKLKDGQLIEQADSYPWPQNTFHTRAQALYEDSSGRLWAGLATAGVYYLEPDGQWQALVSPSVFSQVLVNTIVEEGAGNLWVGLDGAQMDQVRMRMVRSMYLPTNASQNVIRMVCVRRDGSVWVGTDGAGVFRCQNGEWKQFGPDDGLRNRYIGVIFEDSKTNLWVGTWNGLFRLVGERFIPVLASATIRAMHEDRKQNLWIGCNLGVIRLSGHQAQVVSGGEGYAGAEVMAISQDAAGTMWAALGSRGVFRLKGDQFEHVESPWSGPADTCSLLADADGGLWVSSLNRGLAYLKDGQAKCWASKDGVPSEMIFALAEDDDGNLWCGSDNGIIGCPKARLLSYARGSSPPVLCWQLSVVDGLNTRRCSGTGQPVASRSADGRLWFPDSHALAVFNPNQLQRSFGGSVQPPIIEEALVDGVPQAPEPDGVLRSLSAARSFEFHYASPKLQAPERLQFRYRLSGWDANWVDARQRRVAYYNHLPVGSYEFQVLAGGPDGNWQNARETLRLEIVPRFWELRWVHWGAALTLFGGVMAGVWSVSRARLRRRLATLERQRALDQERSRIARDMHDEIGARLTQISLLSALADDSAGQADEVRTQTKKISGVARGLTRSLDEIVWAVRPQNDNLESLVDYLDESLRDLCEGSTVRYWFSGPPVVPAMEVPANVRHNILLACDEAVNNTLKHSGASEVRVNVRLASRQLEIEIIDDGHGFDVAQGEAKCSGLVHIKQRLAEIGGSCECQSTPGKGTQFKFSVPMKLDVPLPA